MTGRSEPERTRVGQRGELRTISECGGLLGSRPGRTWKGQVRILLSACSIVWLAVQQLGAAEWQLHHASEVVGDLVREPMVVEHDGSLFLSGYGAQNAQTSSPGDRPRLWRSDDLGKNWRTVDVLRLADGVDSTSLDAARGNSDVDLHIASDGTIYFAVMGFDRKTFRGTHISVGASRDRGATWTWNRVSATDLDDRPWVRSTPDGKVHLIWNDGQGVRLAVSEDRGTTWKERDRIREEGGSSHLAVGPEGQMAVRVSPISGSGNVHHDVDLILFRKIADFGPWRRIFPPGERVWAENMMQIATVPRWVEPLAFAPDGGLFHAWAQDGVLQLARRDFSGWRTVSLRDVFPAAPDEEGETMDFFPLLTADQQGRLALTWFHQRSSGLVARIAVARWPFAAEAPQVEAIDEVPVAQTGGEYFPAVWLENGGLGVVLTVQEPERVGFAWRAYREAGTE